MITGDYENDCIIVILLSGLANTTYNYGILSLYIITIVRRKIDYGWFNSGNKNLVNQIFRIM